MPWGGVEITDISDFRTRGPSGVPRAGKNKMAYTAKDPRPPTAFSVPKRNKKLVVWRRGRRRKNSQSEDPHYCKGRG